MRRQLLLSDDGLALRARDGDAAARRELVERWAPRLFAFTRGLAGRRSEVEDVCQDVLLAVLAGLGRFDPGRGTFARWVFTIARNRCRRAGRSHAPLDGEPADGRPVRAPLEDEELSRRLDRAFAALSFDQRAAFLLAEVERLPYEEIAAIEGVRVGTVKSRIGRARERLRSALAPDQERS